MNDKTPAMSRIYVIGLAGGALWMILVSAAYLFGVLWTLRLSGGSARLSWIVAIGSTVALLLSTILFLHKGLILPRNRSPEAVARGRRMGWQFGLIVLIEAAAIALASNLCIWLHQEAWIIPVNLVIVGAHFIPLAWLFQVRPYLWMGVLWCCITLGVVFTTPATLTFGPGQISAWIVLPILGCVLVTWGIVVYLLIWANRVLQKTPLLDVR